MGIVLSGSIGFGAVMNVDGVVDPADYDMEFTDVDPGIMEFTGSASDIKALHWGIAADISGVWYTIGLTTVDTPINTTGDGTGPFSPTKVHLSLEQNGVEKYWFEAHMFFGNVIGFIAWDSNAAAPITLDPADIKYKVDSGLEVAIKTNQLPNLAPTPFKFDLVFEGGGQNQDDHIADTIPEPSTMAMIAIGGLVAVARRRRRR